MRGDTEASTSPVLASVVLRGVPMLCGMESLIISRAQRTSEASDFFKQLRKVKVKGIGVSMILSRPFQDACSWKLDRPAWTRPKDCEKATNKTTRPRGSLATSQLCLRGSSHRGGFLYVVVCGTESLICFRQNRAAFCRQNRAVGRIVLGTSSFSTARSSGRRSRDGPLAEWAGI